MIRCGCCGAEVRRTRQYQEIWGDERSEVDLCLNCFSESVHVGQELRDNSGSISLAITKGEKSISFVLADGRRVSLQVDP